jgi:hypothetical protein
VSSQQTVGSHLIAMDHVIHMQQVKKLLTWRHLQGLTRSSSPIQQGEQFRALVIGTICVRELQRHGAQTTDFRVELQDVLESLLRCCVQGDRTVLSALVVLPIGARVHDVRHSSRGHGLKELDAKQDVTLDERVHVIGGMFTDDQ